MLVRPMAVRRRPGLLGTMARTAVVAGTATATVGAVRGWQGRREQQAAQTQAAQQAAVDQQQDLDRPYQPAQAAADDLAGRLKQLADLRDAGVLTDEEFTAAKAKLLGA